MVLPDIELTGIKHSQISYNKIYLKWKHGLKE
jgi:hypothetical protein